MEPANFPQSNATFGPPKGLTEAEVRSIKAWRGKDSEGIPVVITCWKPTKAEFEKIKQTGRVWLHVYGEGMQPVIVTGQDPFE